MQVLLPARHPEYQMCERLMNANICQHGGRCELSRDGPDHLGLQLIAAPTKKLALITSGLCRVGRTAAGNEARAFRVLSVRRIQVTKRDAAFPCAPAAILLETDAFACGAAGPRAAAGLRPQAVVTAGKVRGFSAIHRWERMAQRAGQGNGWHSLELLRTMYVFTGLCARMTH